MNSTQPKGKTRYESVAASGLTGRSVISLLWAVSGTGGQIVLQVFVLAGLARLLSPADFGTMSAALVVIGMSDVIAQLGFAQAVVQKQELTEDDVQTAFTITCGLGLLFALAIVFGAPGIAQFYRNSQVEAILPALAIVFPISALGAVSLAVLQRKMEFRATARIQIVSYLGYAVVGLSLAYFDAGVWALVIAYLAQAVIRSGMLLRAQPHSVGFRVNPHSARQLSYFGAGVTLGRLGAYCALQGDNLVVGRTLGVVALGFYSRSYNLMTVPVSLLGTAIDNVMFAAMSSIQEEKERVRTAYQRGVAAVAAAAAPMTVFVVVVAPEIVAIVLGPAWSSVVAPLRVLSLSLLFRISYKVSDACARATGKVYSRAWRQYIYAALVIGGGVFGSRYGIVGVAAAVSIAIFINYLWMAQLSLRELQISWGRFIACQRHAILIALVIGPLLYVCTALLRNVDAPAIVVVLLGGVIVAGSGIALVTFAPKVALGPDGAWVIQLLKGRKRSSGH